MFKIVFKKFFLLLVLSLLSIWIYQNYGEVNIVWFGYKIQTSVPVLFGLIVILWYLFKKLFLFSRFIFRKVFKII